MIYSFLSVWKPENGENSDFSAQIFNLNFITFHHKIQGFFVDLEGKTAEKKIDN